MRKKCPTDVNNTSKISAHGSFRDVPSQLKQSQLHCKRKLPWVISYYTPLESNSCLQHDGSRIDLGVNDATISFSPYCNKSRIQTKMNSWVVCCHGNSPSYRKCIYCACRIFSSVTCWSYKWYKTSKCILCNYILLSVTTMKSTEEKFRKEL